MDVSSGRFGQLQVEEGEVIFFPDGLLGLEEYKRFIIIEQENSAFNFLQSIEDANLMFIIMPPELVVSDYSLQVSDAQLQGLDLQSVIDAVVNVIITVRPQAGGITANLKAPLVFNAKNRRGKQIISADDTYQIRHPLAIKSKAAACI